MQSGEVINPSILINRPEEENSLEDKETEKTAKETAEDEVQLKEGNMTSTPSMLNIIEQHSDKSRRPSAVSSFSVLSRITYVPSPENNYWFFFGICISFILGLILGASLVNIFLCDSLDNRMNQTHPSRRHPYLY